MSCPLNAEDPFEPSYDFVRGWIRGLVEVDHTRGDVGFEVAAQRCAAGRNGCEVTSADEY